MIQCEWMSCCLVITHGLDTGRFLSNRRSSPGVNKYPMCRYRTDHLQYFEEQKNLSFNVQSTDLLTLAEWQMLYCRGLVVSLLLDHSTEAASCINPSAPPCNFERPQIQIQKDLSTRWVTFVVSQISTLY